MPYFLKRPAIKTETITVYHDDCRRALGSMAPASVDCVVTDPPYPHIKRKYGTWTEAEWFEMMRIVVPGCMRVLKPTGSAVFILHPNSEKLGRMRTWLWRFMLWVAEEYGVIQDAYWWNITALPDANAMQGRMMRSSVKSCVWVGPSDCWRNQDAVLWSESDWNKVTRLAKRALSKVTEHRPSGASVNNHRARNRAVERGGVTPFNLLPVPSGSGQSLAPQGHGASTPMDVMAWWVRYLCPVGGTVLDPFLGSGTAALVAHQEGRKCVGIENKEEYIAICKNRINQLK